MLPDQPRQLAEKLETTRNRHSRPISASIVRREHKEEALLVLDGPDEVVPPEPQRVALRRRVDATWSELRFAKRIEDEPFEPLVSELHPLQLQNITDLVDRAGVPAFGLIVVIEKVLRPRPFDQQLRTDPLQHDLGVGGDSLPFATAEGALISIGIRLDQVGQRAVLRTLRADGKPPWRREARFPLLDLRFHRSTHPTRIPWRRSGLCRSRARCSRDRPTKALSANLDAQRGLRPSAILSS